MDNRMKANQRVSVRWSWDWTSFLVGASVWFRWATSPTGDGDIVSVHTDRLRAEQWARDWGEPVRRIRRDVAADFFLAGLCLRITLAGRWQPVPAAEVQPCG